MNVEYIDHMGNDESVASAARVSFDKRAETYPPDANHGLIRYLARNQHEIPFAHAVITLRVTAPIAVRAQAFKHKVGFVESEISRRYVSEEPDWYLPVFRERAPSVKQGSGVAFASPEQSAFQEDYEDAMEACIKLYNRFIEAGVAPEQARFILPQGVMTQWVWTGSLLAFSRFYNLRADSHAQREIRELAGMVSDIIAPLYPVSWAALTGETK
jgi:thymidylate synthase (FAD)